MPELAPRIIVSRTCPNPFLFTYSFPSSAVWFKVHQDGLRSGGTWGATPLMAASNAGYKFTIPQCLAPGSYLVRHELVALHAAWAYPGAQFYPSCFQVKVTGSGSTRPGGLVSFPGAYKATDPGVVFDVYRGGKFKYAIEFFLSNGLQRLRTRFRDRQFSSVRHSFRRLLACFLVKQWISSSHGTFIQGSVAGNKPTIELVVDSRRIQDVSAGRMT